MQHLLRYRLHAAARCVWWQAAGRPAGYSIFVAVDGEQRDARWLELPRRPRFDYGDLGCEAQAVNQVSLLA